MEKEKSTNTLEQEIKPNVVAEKIYNRGKTDYYLFHDMNNSSYGAWLSYETLHLIKEKAEKYVICADCCNLSDNEMAQGKIKFRKLPRDWEKLPKAVQERINEINPEYKERWYESTKYERDFAEWKTQQGGTYTIYQLKDVPETRGLRFEPYENLFSCVTRPNIANYENVYTASLTNEAIHEPNLLERLFEKFNLEHPADFKGHSLSVSDVIVIKKGEETTAHYCDSIGFKELPYFTEPPQPKKFVDLNAAARYLQKTYDALQVIRPNSQMSEGGL